MKVLSALLAILLIALATAAEPSPYNPHDISSISLYGSEAVYSPEMCPPSFTFSNRARFLPELANNKIGIRTSDINVNGRRCKADASMLVFVPIGNTDHNPPQWHIEDSRYTGRPVNFTCGEHQFSIRFGYFNDVSTASTGGYLDAQIVYFDFAVIPNSVPFGFCSYSARRIDHDRPLNHAPFPTDATWKKFKSMRPKKLKKNIPAVPVIDDPPSTTAEPSPEATEMGTEADSAPSTSPESTGEMMPSPESTGEMMPSPEEMSGMKPSPEAKRKMKPSP